MLILTIINASGGDDEYIIDYNLSWGDCQDLITDYNTSENPLINFACVKQRTAQHKVP
jgi:hypothetical protein